MYLKSKEMAVVFYKTVWLVDDDELSNYINGSILKNQNFAQSITTFTSIQEAFIALDLAVQADVNFPDLIFLDLEMPGLDGWDFLKYFSLLPKAVKEKCRLYMLSSSINFADAIKVKEYEDVRDFIEKPLTLEKLQTIKAKGIR